LTSERIQAMTSGEFKRTFAHSAISRLRFKTLRRNVALTSDKNH
jgi:epoxyqueuosine reductase QueG